MIVMRAVLLRWIIALYCVWGIEAWADRLTPQTHLLWSELDVSYSEANPDYDRFGNGKGETLQAVVAWHEWRAKLRFANAEFQPSGEVAGGRIKDWWALGAAYHAAVSRHWTAVMSASAQRLTRQRDAGAEQEYGYELAVGASWQVYQPFRIRVDVGVMDLLIDDWVLHAELRYDTPSPVYVVARLRDYADFDLTYYEFGLGIKLGSE